MMNYKQIIAAAIQKVLPEESCAVLEKMLAVPPSPEMGDVAFPCFPFAKKLRKGPPVIAGEIMEALQAEALLANVVQRMEVSGGYLNFHLNRKAVACTVISEILKKGSEVAAETAAQTLSEVKAAMKINYFDDPAFLEEQIQKFNE